MAPSNVVRPVHPRSGGQPQEQEVEGQAGIENLFFIKKFLDS
jgi:hypothetical protein